MNQLLDRQVAAMVTECIVVNNRSTDGTEAAVQSWMQAHPQAPVRLLRNDQNYGLGGSHKVAFQYAVQHNFDYLIVLHGDDQGDIRDVLPLVHSGRHRKYDCCLGSRFMPESRIKGYSTLRVVGNYGFRKTEKLPAIGQKSCWRKQPMKNGSMALLPKLSAGQRTAINC